jgi:acyl carrier protein
MEQKIAEIWQEVLQLEKVGTCDNFFDLGGNSLKAVHLKSRLEEILNREISIVTLFEHTSIHSFIRHLDEAGNGKNSPETTFDRSEEINRARQTRAKQRNRRKR